MDLRNIFDQVAIRMRADLQATRAAIQHPGLKGASLEETFRQFLRQYLPQQLDIATGILVDSFGNHTRQLDIVISDKMKTPIFYQTGDVRVIPVECAYAVIEVKAKLTRSEMESVYTNMQSVRQLQKQSFIRTSGLLKKVVRTYGGEWEIWPINYFVFAFESSDLMGLGTWLIDKYRQENSPYHQRIDTICVLDTGVICNQNADGNFTALPEPGAIVFVCQTKRALLLFYALVSSVLNQTWLPDFQIVTYLGQLAFGPQEPA